MKYLILGAEPAGLTFANCLLDAGIKDFPVIEKENSPRGICGSVSVDGTDLNIGGGHFLDTKRKQVTRSYLKWAYRKRYMQMMCFRSRHLTNCFASAWSD